MHFSKKQFSVRSLISAGIIFCSLFFLCFFGCSDKVVLPNHEQLFEFSNAGPSKPTLDVGRMVKAKIGGGPYRVVPGEVIELTMPAILQVVTAAESGGTEATVPFICRINENGDIVLPVIGEIKAAGKSLSQIESEVVNAYYPKYIMTRPSVFARVLEYKTYQVTISGAVNKPGIYSLRSDQMSIVGVLMEAGGIIEQGAASITINRQEDKNAGNAVKYENTSKAHEKYVAPLLARSDGPGMLKYSSLASQPPEFDVQLKFRQLSPQNTNGLIVVSHANEVILSEQIDVASEADRLTFLSHLSQKEPRIFTGDIEQQLCNLANILRLESQTQQKNNMVYLNTIGITSASNKTTLHNLALTSRFNTNRTDTKLTQYDLQERGFVKTVDQAISMRVDERRDLNQLKQSASIVLPIKGYNIPFADLALQDGDSIIVERLEQPLFSVIGLVVRPGNFPYPPGSKFNLMQTLAFAGGLDPATEPRYATIYRLKPDGQVVHATFEIVDFKDGSELTDSLSVPVKPGDIVSVEHTPRTRTKQFLDSVFRLNIGTYYNLGDAWND